MLSKKITRNNLRGFCIWLIFLGLFSICFTEEVDAWRDVPEYYLTIPVLVMLENNQAASGFYIVANKAVFFVTARHVFLKEDKDAFILASNTATLKSSSFQTKLTTDKLIKLDLNKLSSTGRIIYDKLQDIVVVKIADFINDVEFNSVEGAIIIQTPGAFNLMSMDKDSIRKYEEIIIGNDVFVFGYPVSLGIAELPQIDFSKPLVRKGIVAGKNENVQFTVGHFNSGC